MHTVLSKLPITCFLAYLISLLSCYSIISIVRRLQDGWPEDWDSIPGRGRDLFSTEARPSLQPTQPPLQWLPVAPSLGLKWAWCEPDHLHPFSADITPRRCVLNVILNLLSPHKEKSWFTGSQWSLSIHLCLYLDSFQLFSKLTVVHEIWYEYYAI
jgi:hypothetical protein